MDGIAEQIGQAKDARAKMQRWYDAQLADFQVGISFWSYVTFLLRASKYEEMYSFDFTYKQVLFKLAILPVTYLVANLFRESYDTPPEFRRRGDRHMHTYRTRVSVDEIETRYGVRIDTSRFSSRARELLHVE